jgi:hypothetical protein
MKHAAIGLRKPRPKITRGRWGGFDTVLVSGVRDDHENAPTLVLLHGFGAHPMSPGLLHAAKLAAGRGSMRVFIPSGCERYGDGRAWWGGDGRFWPAHSSGWRRCGTASCGRCVQVLDHPDERAPGEIGGDVVVAHVPEVGR